MNNNKEIILESARLKFRRPTTNDVQEIFTAYASDPQVTKYLLFTPHQTLDDTIAYIHSSDEQWAKKTWYNFVILTKVEDKLIGGIGLALDYGTLDTARIGYVLNKPEWGKGYATEACQRIIEFAKECGVRKLVASIHPENIGSIRVLEKCGFQEDEEAGATYFMPNLRENVKLVRLSRCLSMSVPPPDLIWEGS